MQTTNVTANDYAPAVAGQLKWLATKAKEELDENLLIGSGTGVASIVNSFLNKRNLAPALLGQLKNVSRPYYDRLIAAGYATNYPWSATTADDKDFAPALIGQLKNVFNFDVTPDSDGDGLPDWWEIKYGLNPTSGVHASLVGWWKFDDGSGTNASNSASIDYHGQLINMSTSTWVSGKLGSALHFDGINDYVRVLQSPVLITGPQFTACAWVYLDTDSGDDYPTIISDFDPCYNGFWLGWDNWSPGIGGVVSACGSSFIYPSYNASITGTWAYIAMTYDGSTLIVYRNGVEITSDSGSFTPALQSELRIGWANDSSASYYWIGKLDDVRLYSSALTSNQVVNMYDIFNDQDGDGLNNLQEFQGGTDPLNSNSYLTSISGSISYSGGQTGVIRVLAMNPSSAVYSAIIAAPGTYVISNIPTLKAYSLTAWLDSDGDQTADFYEASGAYTNNPVMISNAVSGMNVVLTDGDIDDDGMPDWWELLHQLNPVEANDADADADGDGNTNEQEYGLGTNPHGEGYVNSKEIKILIKDSGLYRITKSAITNVLDMTEVEVSNTTFRLSNMGTAVPTVRDDGDIIFFGQDYRDIYTDHNAYILKPGVELVPQVVQVTNALLAPLESFVFKIRPGLLSQKEGYLYATNSIDGPWHWHEFFSTISSLRKKDVQIVLPSIDVNSAGIITIGLKGGYIDTTNVNHSALIMINSNILGTIYFSERQFIHSSLSIPASSWNTSSNLISVIKTSTNSSRFYLDYVDIEYSRLFEFSYEQILASTDAGIVRYSDIPTNSVWIWDVSSPLQPTVLDGYIQQTTNGPNIIFSNNMETVAICVSGQEYAPYSVVAIESNSSYAASNRCDYLMIVGGGLESEARSLASHRSSNGLQVCMVNIDDIFNKFNHGRRSGESLRKFIKYTHNVWELAPKFVVLVGDGSVDYKGYLSSDCQIPAEPFAGGVLGTVGGLVIADFNVSDFNLDLYPEVIVGRIPASSTNDLAVYINNILDYEAGGPWRTNTLIVNHGTDDANFIGAANEVQDMISNYTHIIRVDRNVIGLAEARSNVLNGITSGLNMLTFAGHGLYDGYSVLNVAGEIVLKVADTEGLATQNVPAVYVTMACSSGQFGIPNKKSISESVLFKRGVGVAVLSSAGVTDLPAAKLFAYPIYDAIYLKNIHTIGDAFLAGQIGLYGNPSVRQQLKRYQLLGDPALIINDDE